MRLTLRVLALTMAVAALQPAPGAHAGALADCAAGDRRACLDNALNVADRDLVAAESAVGAAVRRQPDVTSTADDLATTFRDYRRALCGLERARRANADADLAELGCLVDLTRAHVRELMTRTALSFDDPAAYCRAAGTTDGPDIRYVGPAVPDWMAAAVRAHLGAAAFMPLDIYRRTVWRCADGAVLACAPGANLPCREKADASRTPRESVRAWCRGNPDADFVPMAVTGRATIYDWRCRQGNPAIVKERAHADAQGYIADVWFAVAPDHAGQPIGRLSDPSSFAATRERDEVVTATRNVTYRLAGPGIPGLGADDRLVIRQTIGVVQALDEKGARAVRTTAEAWRLGDDLAGQPLYVIDEPGDDAEVALADFFVVWGENTDWLFPPKTAFALGTGKRVFVATAPWARFYVEGQGADSRYVAFASANAEELNRDIPDAPTLVGVITYASRTAALQRLRIVAATEDQARALRAVEENAEIDLVDRDGRVVQPFDAIDVAADAAVNLRLRFPFNKLEARVPLRRDRFDASAATVPPGLSFQAVN